MKRCLVWTLSAALICPPALSGCSILETRPGHPESYDNGYYNKDQLWPTSVKPDNTNGTSTGSQTPVFLTARTPVEIWQARGYTYNMHLKYQAAAYHAEDVQDGLAIPVFGAAIATVATAIGRASTVAIAATGLGGASAAAGYAYLHPDKDAATNQTAASALMCIVDQSKVLNDMSAVPLVLDQAALQDALNKLITDSGSLMQSVNPVDQQAQTAVRTVQTAAAKVMSALDSAISAYVALPSEIYEAADSIDQTAKSGGARSLDYQSILSSLKTSANNQSSTNDAKSQVQQANATAAQASSAPAQTPQAQKVTQPDGSAPATNLTTTQANVTSATTSVSIAQPTNQTTQGVAGSPSIGTTTKSASLSTLLNDTTISDLTRVTLLSQAATNDIPSPNFSDVAANIKNCGLSK